MYPAKCLLGTTIQQVGHTPTPVKADWTKSRLLAFDLIRIFVEGQRRMATAIFRFGPRLDQDPATLAAAAARMRAAAAHYAKLSVTASELAQMSVEVTLDGYVFFAVLTIASIASVFLAGRIAERRGRRFIVWAWIAAIIGPLVLPLIFLFPNLRRENGNHA